MKTVYDKLIKHRYLFAVILFILCVSLNLHGSSIANWNNYGVTEMVDGSQSTTINQFGSNDKIDIIENIVNWISLSPRSDGTIIGVPRMIRSDEWLVQTPYFISQNVTGNQFVNPLYGISGQNMIVSYNAPVADISSIGKPFSWGFILFGPEKGLSWYWSFKTIAMILLAFEFSMILTKKNKFLSVVGSFWITFTPSIQWWFMQHHGDVVFLSLLLVVSIIHFFEADSKLKKVLLCLPIISGLVGFPLVIYPAFQIPYVYLIACIFLIYLIKNIRSKILSRFDILAILIVSIISFSILGITLFRSIDAIKAILSTIYPGSRVSVGGDQSFDFFSLFFASTILPFKIPHFANQVELAQSIHLLFPILFMLPFSIKKTKIKENIIGLAIVAICLLLIFYVTVGVPEIVAKLTFLSYVTSSRAVQALSVFSVFASIWYISYLWKEEIRNKRLLFILGMLPIIAMAVMFTQNPDYIGYTGKSYLMLVVFSIVALLVFSIWKRKLVFSLLLLSLITLSGVTVNPLSTGLGVIEDKKLSVVIRDFVKDNPDATWVTEGQLYNYPQMFGAKTLNSVRFYPDEDLMNILDEDGSEEVYWNRYAHMKTEIIEGESQMENPVPDVLNLSLDDDLMDDISIDYVLTNRDLSSLFPTHFTRVYGPDLDGNQIFELNN